MKFHRHSIFWMLVSLVTIVVVYLPLFSNGFVNWDDDVYILRNSLIQSINRHSVYTWFTQPFLGLYQPLVLFTLALDYYFSGLNPVGFHFTNLVLHVLNTLLVFRLMEGLFKNRNISILVTLLFGLHALHVESVAWASERKNLLFVFFYLAGLVAYITYLKKGKKRFLLIVYLLFIASLLSKASAVTFPLILLLTDYLKSEKFKWVDAIKKKLPLFFLSFAFGILTLWVHQQSGSLGNTTGFSFPERMAIALYSLFLYFIKLSAPVYLTTFNPMPASLDWPFIRNIIISLSFLIMLGFLIFWNFRRNKEVIWAIGFLLINLGLFLIPPGVPVQVSDRYVYPGSIGFFVILAMSLNWLIIKAPKFKYATFSFFSVYLLFIGYTTFQQVKTWENSIRLWSRVIDVHDDVPFALMQRGNACKLEKKYEQALEDYTKAIKADPEFGRAYEQRGHLLSIQKKYSDAIYDFESVIKMKPESYFAHCSLGFIYRQTGNPELSLSHLNKALLIYPTYTTALINRGKTYMTMNNPEAACIDFREALSLTRQQAEKAELSELIQLVCKE
ncbi:MAG: tetratricopeptide repeat protein [Bacteroidales bacterium]|nr:tetratricopeptide repeat protein [Bacteroidales bacterium]